MENSALLEPDTKAVKKTVLGRYWKKILGQLADSVVVYDPSGTILYANKMASDGLGYASISHLMHQTVDDIIERYIMLDDEGRALSVLDMPNRRALISGDVERETIHFVPADGAQDFWLEIQSFPVVDRHHTTKFIVSVYHDISPYKAVEARLSDTNRRITGILDNLLKLD